MQSFGAETHETSSDHSKAPIPTSVGSDAFKTAYERLLDWLILNDIAFDLLPHSPEGQTERASAIRGHQLKEAAKSMVIECKPLANDPNQTYLYALVVVRGDHLVDLKRVARMIRGRKASFAPPSVATDLTGCEMGTVMPISLNGSLPVLVDRAVMSQPKIVFNAGRLDRSVAVAPASLFEHCSATMAEIARRRNTDAGCAA